MDKINKDLNEMSELLKCKRQLFKTIKRKKQFFFSKMLEPFILTQITYSKEKQGQLFYFILGFYFLSSCLKSKGKVKDYAYFNFSTLYHGKY